MTRRALASVVGLLAIALPAGTDTKLRVLFIGNSYTFGNNLPALVEGLGSAAGVRIHTRTVAVSGSTLRGHWDRGKAAAAIREGNWDWVVLQEHSSLGVPLIVDGIPRITEPRRFWAAARRFDEEIRETGARTMLLLTWSAQSAPDEQQNLGYAYMTLAKELGAAVAPAGLAWHAVRTEDSEVPLYMPDGAHPAPAGSYLAACALYAALTGRSPEGLPGGIAGLEQPGARILQRAAWRAHRQLSASGGYLNFPEPAPPALPEVPTGRRPQREELAGVWEGELRFHRHAARMELRLTHDGENWRARMSLFFDGRQKDVRTYVSGFAVTGEGIRFIDRTQAPSRARFRGAFTGELLQGTAELIAPQGRRTAIGSWQLMKTS